ncbi:ribosomal subunit interface protein [Sesbania bispinosa]|nr:ribosomal subunit interface protein [Sesbania bispinosa]
MQQVPKFSCLGDELEFFKGFPKFLDVSKGLHIDITKESNKEWSKDWSEFERYLPDQLQKTRYGPPRPSYYFQLINPFKGNSFLINDGDRHLMRKLEKEVEKMDYFLTRTYGTRHFKPPRNVTMMPTTWT